MSVIQLIFSGWKDEPRSVDLVHLLRRELKLSMGVSKRIVDSIVARPVEMVEVSNDRIARHVRELGAGIGLYAAVTGPKLYFTGLRPNANRESLVRLLSAEGGLGVDEAVRLVDRLVGLGGTTVESEDRECALRCREEAELLGFVCTLTAWGSSGTEAAPPLGAAPARPLAPPASPAHGRPPTSRPVTDAFLPYSVPRASRPPCCAGSCPPSPPSDAASSPSSGAS